MVALRSFTDETERELAQTVAHHTQLTRHIQALKSAGEPLDSSFLRKLGWQLDACVRWIARYRRDLDMAAVLVTQTPPCECCGTIPCQKQRPVSSAAGAA